MTSPISLFATHNRAGQITVRQTGPLTIEVTIITYTKSDSPADRDRLTIFWGDGTSQEIFRSNGNGNGQDLGNLIRYNTYIAEHTYPGRGTYKIGMADPNRNGGILNVNNGRSDEIQFYLETEYTFLHQQFQGNNNTPILLQPPIDAGCTGQFFVHNPNAYDVDGDSLAYELILPLQGQDQPVPNYLFPNQISPGGNNNISFNTHTGEFRWESPQRAGEYNIAIVIREYRNGILISSTIRDMQILITNCNNRPPVVEAEEDHCIIAGNQLNIPLLVDDPDLNQKVKIEPFGGPFVQEYSPAQIIGPDIYADVPFDAMFQWNTTCEHITKHPYRAIIRATDNYNAFGGLGSTNLTTLKTLNITVTAPPPLNLIAESGSASISLSWDSPYRCEDEQRGRFLGFDVWRRNTSNSFPLDICVGGLEGRGYTQVAFLTNEIKDGSYFYEDFEVEKGRTYCYRITAVFGEKTTSNQPYNIIHSLPSQEACEHLVRDIPFPLNVDIRTTETFNGEIYIRWARPDASDLDTIINPGPYTYVLEHADGFSEDFFPIPGASVSSTFFSDEIDTTFLDTNRNTLEQAYNYRIAFYTNGITTSPYDYSPNASSIRLNAQGLDERVFLTWEENVPWENYDFTIYRLNETTGAFDSVGTTSDRSFTDNNLENDRNYCYKIKAKGSYGVTDLPSPLINFSQEICVVTQDIYPPCPPIVQVVNPCNDPNLNLEQFVNIVRWELGIGDCNNSDLSHFNIYYGNTPTSEFTFLATVDKNIRSFEHNPQTNLQSCYIVTAVDNIGNETEITGAFCAESCPDYILPNTFTPNSDGANDFFEPIVNRFIESVEFKVYNRWGALVYETQNPEINWDGTGINGKALDAATYFYTCFYYKINEPNTGYSLTGYIELIK